VVGSIQTNGTNNTSQTTLNLTSGTGLTVTNTTGGTVQFSGTAATTSALGLVKTDGSTISNSSGLISCTTASTSQVGCVKPDGSTITISGGVISAGGSSGPGMTWVANIFTNYQYSYTSMFAPPGFYGDPTQGTSYATSATNAYIEPLASCTLDSMFVINYTNNTSVPVTTEVYVNGTGQSSFKCTANAGIGTTCSVTGQSVAVAATDKISLGLTTTGNFGSPASTGSFQSGGFFIALHCK
jgi:hypothetical protein